MDARGGRRVRCARMAPFRSALALVAGLAMGGVACGGGSDREEPQATAGAAGAAAGAAGAGGQTAGMGGVAGTGGGGMAGAGAGGAGAGGAGGGGAVGGLAFQKCAWTVGPKKIVDLGGFSGAKRMFDGHVLVEKVSTGAAVARAFLSYGGDMRVVDLGAGGPVGDFTVTLGAGEAAVRSMHVMDRTFVWANRPAKPEFVRVFDADSTGATVQRSEITGDGAKGRPVFVHDGVGGAFFAYVEDTPTPDLVTGQWTGVAATTTTLITGAPAGLEPRGMAVVDGTTHVFTTDLQQVSLDGAGKITKRSFASPLLADASAKAGAVAAFSLFLPAGPMARVRGARVMGAEVGTFDAEKMPFLTELVSANGLPGLDVVEDHVVGFGGTGENAAGRVVFAVGIDSGLRGYGDLGGGSGAKVVDSRVVVLGGGEVLVVWTEVGDGGVEGPFGVGWFGRVGCGP